MKDDAMAGHAATPPPPSDETRFDQMARGARAMVPVSFAIIAFGLVWGVLAGQAGLSLLEVVLMSALVFAGASQFVAIDIWAASPDAVPVGALAAAAIVVNLRFLLLSATLRPLFGPRLPPAAPALMFLVADENWALTIAEMNRRPTTAWFFLGTGLLMASVWIASTAAGRLLGSTISDPAAYGLDFAFTATFLALLLGMWRGRGDLLPWIVGALAAILAARLIEGNWYIILGGLAGSLAGALRDTLRRGPDETEAAP